ncbi:dienelactone hydrolase family protein [Pseudoxanthobacter sp. M-2]|uniref:dienelactone hydrolase family protein n=1 Tax=Pseudoxanthobacter sp. M-2 TaxID=3078754 RepID=UPI0038FC1E1F
MCTLDGCGSHADMPPIFVSATDRRAFLAGLGALPLAAVLADPVLAQAAAAKVTPVSITTVMGKPAKGFIAKPAQLPAPAIVLIHEWWGLNDQIKAVAADLADKGYIAIAIDLFGKDEPATTADEAKAQMAALNTEDATDAVSSWVYYARDLQDATDKVGTVGWCFGGAWSLNASIAAPVDATVIYYGNVTRTVSQLENLKGPVLGHFGTLDQSINKEMVEGFEKNMAAAGKADSLTVYWYDADHAFANPTGSRYDAADAATAWQRTLDFYTANLT